MHSQTVTTSTIEESTLLEQEAKQPAIKKSWLRAFVGVEGSLLLTVMIIASTVYI
jgi:hypothetical protein